MKHSKIQRGLILLNKDYVGQDIQDKTTSNNYFHIVDSSNIVFIVNGGLTAGGDNVSIVELFVSSGFNQIEEVFMVPGKQYAFVILSYPSEAEKAVETISGKKCLPHRKYPLYMTCIDKAPPIKDPIKYMKPPGLILIENFISDEEEDLLSRLINWNDDSISSSEGSTLKQRQVRHFGYEFKYSSNAIDKSPLERSLPSEVIPICQRICNQKLMSHFPDQLTVNRYLPGQGIPPHVDTHSSFMDEIISLSVVGGTAMEFRCEDPKNPSQVVHHSVYLPAKSLCVMTGPARYSWTHGISARKTDILPSAENPKKLMVKPRCERISFTFRKVRSGDCSCSFQSKCDSQQSQMSKESFKPRLPVSFQKPLQLEKKHVIDVYENIAHHFSDTRHKPWPKVFNFVQSLPVGTIMLDVGCGNGKYLGQHENIYQIGCDTSNKLLEICRSRNIETSVMNCLSLPFRDELFDAVISIAVIHHLASEERRRKAVSEMIRVLRRDGVCLIYVWAMEQRKGKMSAYLKQKRSNRKQCLDSVTVETDHSRCQNNLTKEIPENALTELHTLPIHENRSDFIEQDLFVPWKIKPHKHSSEETLDASVSSQSTPIYHRFYHVFREGELDNLISTFSSIRIIQSYYDEGNWCVMFKKC